MFALRLNINKDREQCKSSTSDTVVHFINIIIRMLMPQNVTQGTLGACLCSTYKITTVCSSAVHC